LEKEKDSLDGQRNLKLAKNRRAADGERKRKKKTNQDAKTESPGTLRKKNQRMAHKILIVTNPEKKEILNN